MDKKVFLITNGCPENRIDIARMQEFLGENDWIITKNIKDADLILFNTCGITHQTQDISMKMIKQLEKRKNSSAKLIVYGCMSKININGLRDYYNGHTFGSDDIQEINKIIDVKTDPEKVKANYILPHCSNVARFNFPDLRNKGSLIFSKYIFQWRYYKLLWQAVNVFNPNSYIIKVSTGCLFSCAYCAIKLSRGNVKSKSIPLIIEELKNGLAKGYTDFSLIGTDLGSYGKDLGTDLSDLLQQLVKIKGDFNLCLRNVHPKFLIEKMDKLEPVFQTGKIAYIESAAQSGNNRILKLMNRTYTIENYKKAILNLNKKFPEIKLRTQLIVGFPTETDAEFQDTLDLIDEIYFDLVEVYQFESVLGTKANYLADHISKKVAKKRYKKLLIKSLSNQKERKRKAIREYKEKFS